jgi:hypothetical protein
MVSALLLRRYPKAHFVMQLVEVLVGLTDEVHSGDVRVGTEYVLHMVVIDLNYKLPHWSRGCGNGNP